MSYQVLARKYRPQNFSNVIGQEHVTRTLRNALEQRRIAHGYIFSGHRGIGKTTVARILAMALNCRSATGPVPEPCGKCDSCLEIRAGNSVDVIEIDAATNRGIDEIRELRDAARYRPARDRYKIYILDEAHQITDAAFNALLKTLEEPPGHVVFMMATTQPEDIPQTIRSRCQHFSFHAVRFEDIVNQLRAIAKQESIKADEDSLALLAEAGDGSVRDALSIMDQAIACCGTTLTPETIRGLVGTVPAEALENMMNTVAQGSSQEMLRIVDKLVSEGQNPTHLARQLVRFLRNVLVAKVSGSDSPLLQISSDERSRAARVAEMFAEEDLTRFLQIMLRAHSDISYKAEQRFHLELGLLKLVHAQRLLPIEQVLSGVSTEPAHEVGGGGSTVSRSTPAKSANTPQTPTISPFERDRARKTASISGPAEGTSSFDSPISGSAAVAVMTSAATAVAVAVETSEQELQLAVIQALENASQRVLAATLEGESEWRLEQNDLLIKVARPASFLEMAVTAEARRIITAAASATAGRTLKIRIESNGSANGNGHSKVLPRTNGAGESARSRAANDPIVRRMQEKFGAEIRTVIDHRDKKR
ncbi:MAG: DNA polymerase III subunit gamma/tau [Acidobacteriales bacterium]|nr:DNA polymerase III subunit gamma/tau [Terriglobales bacterium]